MAGTSLRFLQDGLDAQWSERRCHVLALMPYDRYDFAGLERLAGAHHMLDERAPARAMQHLRQRGFKSRAFAGRENHNYEVRSRHEHIVNASRPFDNEGGEAAARMGHLRETCLGALRPARAFPKSCKCKIQEYLRKRFAHAACVERCVGTTKHPGPRRPKGAAKVR